MEVKEKVLNLLDEKVNEIFYQMQEELNIEDGDILPWDKMELDNRMEDLADKIVVVLNYQN